jgi:predicted nucleic acid-binding protein
MELIRRGELPLTRFYTTDYIIDETLTFLSRVVKNHSLAVDVGKALLQSPLTSIIYVDQELFQMSWERFQSIERPNFTDCASFTAMDEAGVSHAFTYDSHFKTAGYRTLRD